MTIVSLKVLSLVHKITTEEPAALEDADPQLSRLALELLNKRERLKLQCTVQYFSKAAWNDKNLRTREEAQRCASSWVERIRRCRENLADPKPQAVFLVFCSSPLLASTGFLVQLRGLPKIASMVANRCYFSSKNTVKQKNVPVCNGPVLEDRR